MGRKLAVAAAIAVVAYFLAPYGLRGLGKFLVVNDVLEKSDAVVVLSTGVEYYPRLMESADLYRRGLAEYVVINGNRKSAELRELERLGFERCCGWDQDAVRILQLLGVPDERIIRVSAEDAFDTVSEARAVGAALRGTSVRSIIVATSRSHTRRARYIWSLLYGEVFTVNAAAAGADPFDPAAWWRQPRQIRWVLAEYGGWCFLWWQRWFGPGLQAVVA